MNWVTKIVVALTLTILSLTSFGQSVFPEKPIRLVVPYPPGSGTDTIARYTAQRLETVFKQPVVVENKVGGNAIIAAQAVISSQPDGYTLLWAANGPVTTNAALYDKLPYDPLRDLLPVARLAYSPMGLFVPANSQYKSASELFSASKQQPGKLNYASGSATYNIATEWLMSVVGGKATAINYKGSAPAIVDVASGQVDFAIVEFSAALPMVQAKKLKLLAVTTEQRMLSEPTTPTIQELGYKDYFQVAWWGVFAPKGTPQKILNILEQTLLEIYSDAETQEYMNKNNYSLFTSSGAELRAFQEAEIQRETEIVNKFNIQRM